MKKLMKWRNKLIVNNPILESYISFTKGVLCTVLVYEYLVN